MAERDILGLDLDQVDPQEVDELFKGAMFNKGISSSEVLGVAEAAVEFKKTKTRLKTKKGKGEGFDPLFKISAMLRRD